MLTTASDGNSVLHSFPLNVPPEFHRYSVKQEPLANSETKNSFHFIQIKHNYNNLLTSYTLNYIFLI